MKEYLKKLCFSKINVLIAIIVGSIFMIGEPHIIIRIIAYIVALLFINLLFNKSIGDKYEQINNKK